MKKNIFYKVWLITLLTFFSLNFSLFAKCYYLPSSGEANKFMFVRTIGLSDLIVQGEIININKLTVDLKIEEIIKGKVDTSIIKVDREKMCSSCNKSASFKLHTKVIFLLFRKGGNHYYLRGRGNTVIYINSKKSICYSTIFRKADLENVKNAIKNFPQCFEINKEKYKKKGGIEIICSKKELEIYQNSSDFHSFIVQTIYNIHREYEKE